MTICALLINIVVSLGVVIAYHLWVTRKKEPAITLPAKAAAAPLPPVAAPAPAPVPSQPPPPTVPVAAVPLAAAQTPPEILAVIAAAIAVVLGPVHRVLAIEQAATQTREVNVWALEGRVEQFMSHRIR